MSSTTRWVIGLFVGFFLLFGLFVFFLFTWIFAEPYDESESTSGARVAVVELKEPIYSSEETVRQFKKYRENKAVKAIVFRVDSPGGGVAASQEIYEEVKKTRDGGKPVVVSMGGIAASGGYYVSCGASKIVANPGTLTGSIGVIFQFLQIDELMKKVGVDATTVKSGKLKDAGSPFRKPTEEEKKFFQSLIDNTYDQFVDVVANERKIDRKEVIKYADGRVFTGKQALAYGFVDTLGTLEDAISIAAEMGDIKGKPKVVKERKRKSFWGILTEEARSEIGAIRDELFSQPFLQYKFTYPAGGG